MVEINGVTMTDQEAKKELARIARKQRKADKILAEEKDRALADAHYSLAMIVHHIGRMRDGQRDNWIERTCHPKSHIPYAGRVEWEQQYSTANASGAFVHYGYKPIKIIDSVAGTVAVLVQDDGNPKNREWLAVGCCNGRVVFCEIPKFLNSDMNKIGAGRDINENMC